MRKPEKPKNPGCRQSVYLYLDYPIKFNNLQLKINAFIKKHGIPSNTIELDIEENWSGYEDVDVQWKMYALEAESTFQKRNQEYEEDMTCYEVDLIKWKLWEAKDQKARELVNKERKLQNIDKQIEQLQQKKEELT